MDTACPTAPFNGSFATNVNVNVTGSIVSFGQNSSVFDPSNFNLTGQWIGLDPGFAAGSVQQARDTGNFQLVDNSSVYTQLPGFERIPMECFGPMTCLDHPTPYPRAATIDVWGRDNI